MIIEFDCFLIDEVGAVGDARFHDRCSFELFTKRADRAMIIISHSGAYIRDHCDRFAVLHDSKLTLYDDFDMAYGAYAQLVSLTHASAVIEPTTVDRASPRDVILRSAIADERFRLHFQRGDWARNRHDWADAETEYAAALALHPFASTYWSQLGHTARAQSKFAGAEIAYRNACALGQPVHDVRPFLVDVMAHQSVDENAFPIHCLLKGPLSAQSPVSPDVLVLAWAFWGVETIDEATLLHLLRTSPTLDDLASGMIAEPNRRGATPCNLPNDIKRVQSLCQLARPDFDFHDPDVIRAQFDQCRDVVSEIVQAFGFSEWPKTLAALAETQPAHNFAESDR